MKNIIGATVLIIALFASQVLMVNPATAANDPIGSGMVIWSLSKLRIVDPGVEITGPEGTFIDRYTLEAKASPKQNHGKTFPGGTFRMTLSAFSPAHDMPGQKAGLWYVQGEWSIVKTGATYADTKERHNPATIAGKCQTELDFNPTAENIDWTARASLPMSPIAGQWGRGEGSLTVNKNATGDLFLKLELWPVQP